MSNPSLNSFTANVIEELRNTLMDRNGSYSDFATNAHIMAMLMRAQGFEIPAEAPPFVMPAPSFLTMAEVYILGKLSRLAASDRTHRDSWVDIAGYAILAIACLDRRNREDGGECETS